MWTVELAVMLVMILINSVFAGYEIALASLSLSRLDTLVHAGRHGAAAAYRMKQNIESSLAVVQLGITLVGVIAAATGGAGAEESIEPLLRAQGLSPGWAQALAIACVAAPLTFVTIIVGELVPKVFALRNQEWVCLRLSPLMEWFAVAVGPVVWLFERSTRIITRWGENRLGAGTESGRDESALQELRALAALARTTRLIGWREEGIIVNAARLSSTPVRNIMLPAEAISMLAASGSLADSLLAAHHDMHTRFPVTERTGDPQAIVGYVNFKDIVSCLRLSPEEPNLRGILRPIQRLEAELPVSACLERLIHGHHHIALVADPAGRVLGMLTLEDILEELVGDIHDEYDRLPTRIVAAGANWVVGGGATAEQLLAATGVELPHVAGSSAANLSDWVQRTLGRPPRGGEILAAGDAQVLVRKTRRHHVLEAQLMTHKHDSPKDRPSPAAGERPA